MIDTSFQVVAEEVRTFTAAVWPVVVLAVYTGTVWTVARFAARVREQRRIQRYLPDIAREEIANRDARIAELETELAAVKARHDTFNAVLRGVAHRTRGVHDLVVDAIKT